MATGEPTKRRHALELAAATAFGVAGAGLLKVLGADGAAGTMLAARRVDLLKSLKMSEYDR